MTSVRMSHELNAQRERQMLDKLKPEYLMFTSSLNVELVYIILKSIIAFSYMGVKSISKEAKLKANTCIREEDFRA